MIMMGDRKKAITEILGPTPQPKTEEKIDSQKVLAQEAIEAAQSGDADAFLSAIKALFMEFDSEPHKEGPHL